ncbi:MAG TPA: hypothetical protein VHC94_08775 [Nitrobacter sp.]|nr:hypothetical protein [Nitrobacter sp.]
MANAGFRLAGAGAVSDLDVGNTLPLSARQNAKRIDDSRTPPATLRAAAAITGHHGFRPVNPAAPEKG